MIPTYVGRLPGVRRPDRPRPARHLRPPHGRPMVPGVRRRPGGAGDRSAVAGHVSGGARRGGEATRRLTVSYLTRRLIVRSVSTSGQGVTVLDMTNPGGIGCAGAVARQDSARPGRHKPAGTHGSEDRTMSKRYEVVYAAGASIHVWVEAENEDEATDKAEDLALIAWHAFCEKVQGEGMADNTRVWLGGVDDLAYVDELPASEIHADGMSTTWGV